MTEKKPQLAEFFVSAPLYTTILLAEKIRETLPYQIAIPIEITRFCPSESCGAELKWKHNAPAPLPDLFVKK